MEGGRGGCEAIQSGSGGGGGCEGIQRGSRGRGEGILLFGLEDVTLRVMI